MLQRQPNSYFRNASTKNVKHRRYEAKTTIPEMQITHESSINTNTNSNEASEDGDDTGTR